MKRRVFVGLPISGKLRQEISCWESGFDTLAVRWLLPKNLHLTIIPPWYEENLENILERIKSVKAKPFEINLVRVSYGPNKHQPRLVWAQGPVPGGLLRLKDALENALQKDSLIKDYLLHLTLARFPAKRFSEFKIKTLEEKVSWKEKIDSFVLYESHLQRGGANYQELWVRRLG